MFTLTDKEHASAKRWFKEHECSMRCPRRDHYPYYYKFTPVGFADDIEVGCSDCGEHTNISDVEIW